MNVDRQLERLCVQVALAGGLLLIALIGVECVSVVGRSLPELLGWTGLVRHPHPVPGDAEIAQALTAVALFAFLPYCQIRGEHVRVDVFSHLLPQSVNAWLDRLWHAVFVVIASILAWRLTLGWLNKWDNGDTTMVLHIPEAMPFGMAVGCTLLLVAAIARSLFVRPDD